MRRHLLGLLLLAGLVLPLASPAAASATTSSSGSWTMAQHDPGRSGWNQGESTLTAASAKGLRLRWTGPVGVDVDANTPAIVDGTVYLTSNAGGAGQTEARDVQTGKVRWAHSYTKGAMLAAPTVWGDIVYVSVMQDGPDRGTTLYAYDRSSGRLVWRVSESAMTGAPAQVVTSGTVGGGLLYVPFWIYSKRQSHLVAFDLTTGKVRWQRVDDAMYGVWGYQGMAYSNGRLFLQACGVGDCIQSISASTGRTLATFALNGQDLIRPPVVVGDTVYVAQQEYQTDDGPWHSLVGAFPAAGCGTAPTCPPMWTARLYGAVSSDLTVANGQVLLSTIMYGDDPTYAYALNASTGRTAWTWRGGGGDAIVPAPVTAAGHLVYVADEASQTVYVLDQACQRSACRQVTELPLPSHVAYSRMDGVSVAAGMLLVHGQDRFFAYGL